ncbi:MAG TPA: PSD1 and planctomycete cytochrome C domain-containing protein, partial [Verrucomicrobiaceae bacterium]
MNSKPLRISEFTAVVRIFGGLFFVLMATSRTWAEPVDFVRDIQPILAERCYQCHGPKRGESGLRLDHKGSAMRGGDHGPVIVPRDPSGSVLVRAIQRTDAKLKMPKKGGPLDPAQVEKIVTWINEGATWPDAASASLVPKAENHWAFKAPVKAEVPSGAPHPIDAFVRARLAKEHLPPSPPAAPEKLLRRLYLDLTGLPPSPNEVDAFVKDQSSESYRRVVEQLLASPHYGERWGRHWLDAAHYADSNGYEKDPMRYIWFYRDWVIQAFNRDLPYDQFIIEQLAGDLLPNATQDQIVATGFLRNTMVNEEGGVDPEQFRMEAMFDRMDVIGKSILGLTINCCQCHDHKYDPITQEEYYRIFAFLNNDNEPWRVVYSAEELARKSNVQRRIAALENRLKLEHPDWRERMQAWEGTVKHDQPEWHVLQAPFINDSTGGQKFLRQADGSYLAQSYAPTKSSPKFEIKVKDGPITGFRLELLNDPNLPAYGPGRSPTGVCALTEFAVDYAPVDDASAKPKPVKFSEATADFGEPENTPLVNYARDKDPAKDKRITGPVSYAIDGKNETAWGIDAGPGRRNQPRKAVFVCESPIDAAEETKLTITLKMSHGGWNSDDLQTMNLGRFRISYTTAPHPAADPLPHAARGALNVPEDQRNAAQITALFSYWRGTVPEWKRVNGEIETLWKSHPEGTTTLVLDRREQPRMTNVLKRGDFLKPGDRVAPGVPAVLHPMPRDADGSRLSFAKWIVDRRSPVAARAWVNRVWQAYFGTGLSNTPEDLGTQGEMPSHPELLDWLACEFMDNGWSTKALHRLIVSSETYRQDSAVGPALLEKDPFNRLLARGPRFRVEGEVVRDIQLAASGLLNPAVGGRPVMPPAPAFLFERPASYAPFPWKVEPDENQFRRAVYIFRRRSTPYPFLSAFDVPNGEAGCVRRARSNTPLQALMTLNETMSMDAAKA